MPPHERLVFKTFVPRSARRAAHVLDGVGADEGRHRRAVRDRRRRRSRSRRTASIPRSRPATATPATTCCSSDAVERRKNPLAAAEAASAVGLPLVVAGPVRDAELARELERARRPAPRLRVEGGARRALPRRGLSRDAVALRGIRPARAGGDGLRDARRRRAGSGAPRGGRRRGGLRRARAAGRRHPAGARPSATGSSRPGSSGRSASPGRRRRAARSPSTRRCSQHERLRRRRLPRPPRGARGVAARRSCRRSTRWS